MNRRRLPPQPADTRLARFVGRLIGRLYRARIWAVQNSPVVRRDTYERLADRHYHLRNDYFDLQDRHRLVKRDFSKLMPRVRPSIQRVSHRYDTTGPDPVHITSVHFRPLNVASTVRRDVPAVDLHPYTKVVLEDQARSIAMRHAEEVAAAIVQQVVPSGLRSAGGGK